MTVTKYNINWQQVHRAWKRSGLSLKVFYRTESFRKMAGDDKLPCYETLRIHIRELDATGAEPVGQNRVVARESAGGRKPAKSASVSIHKLDAAKVSLALAQKQSSPGPMPKPLQTKVLVTLPNQTLIEFNSSCAELFALQAMRDSREAARCNLI